VKSLADVQERSRDYVGTASVAQVLGWGAKALRK
jgi:hypothetical protein